MSDNNEGPCIGCTCGISTGNFHNQLPRDISGLWKQYERSCCKCSCVCCQDNRMMAIEKGADSIRYKIAVLSLTIQADMVHDDAQCWPKGLLRRDHIIYRYFSKGQYSEVRLKNLLNWSLFCCDVLGLIKADVISSKSTEICVISWTNRF
jgi:hypothetical protein